MVELEKIDYIFMVGGFSGSEFLTNEIKSNPAFSSIKSISPNEPGTAVLKGTVLFGYNPRAVSARICRYTYGFSVLRDFDSKIHPHVLLLTVMRSAKMFSATWYTKMS